MNFRPLLFVALMPFVLSACSTYDSRYVYEPSPAVVEAGAEDGPQVRTLATVIGVRNPNSETGAWAQVETRIRLQNTGDVPCSVAAEDLLLVTADLTELGATFIVQEGGITVEPGDTAVLEAHFAFDGDADDFDLSGLNLQVRIHSEAGSLNPTLSFQQVMYPVAYRGPWYWDPWYHHSSFHFGVHYGYYH